MRKLLLGILMVCMPLCYAGANPTVDNAQTKQIEKKADEKGF